MQQAVSMSLDTSRLYRGLVTLAWRWVPLLLLLALPGCTLLGGAQLEAVATSAQKPSNVALYVSVQHDGKGVGGLKAQDFRVYEDGVQLSQDQTHLTLLPRDVAAVHSALLLVDMGGQLSEAERTSLAKGVASFVDQVRQNQFVSVYAYDGGEKIHKLGEFPVAKKPSGGEVQPLPAIMNFKTEDESSSLNDGAIQAVEQLDAQLMSVKKPVRLGTLVVVARHADVAKRATPEQLSDALGESPHQLYALSVGAEAEAAVASTDLGRNGSRTVPTMSGAESGLRQLAKTIERVYEQYYLVSYCSPARGGQRQLTLEVLLQDPQGRQAMGSYSTEFDATGFGSGCEPNTTPKFVVAQVTEEEPEEEAPPPEPAQPKVQKPAPKPAAPQPAPQPKQEEIVPPPNRPGYE